MPWPRPLTDPRVAGVLASVPRTVAHLREREDRGPALGAHMLLDEIVMAALRSPALLPRADDIVVAGAEVRAAHPLWAERGWLDDPASYHQEPVVPDARVWLSRTGGRHHHTMTFPVAHEPHPGEPGRDRWLARPQHRTARATLMRHREPGRPWLVCVHGFSQGDPAMDHRLFRAGRLHDDLGINLAFPVLPSHGDRQPAGMRTGEGFTSVNRLDGIHGIAQAVWEIRSLIRWIRAEDPGAPIGVQGVSLGGLVATLVASLEPGLACAIAAIPVADLFELYTSNNAADTLDQTYAAGAAGPEADATGTVVSPLHLTPLVPRERRFVVAGRGDRMSTTAQAERLWEHWGRPTAHWYAGGHVGYFFTRSATVAVESAVRESLL